MKLSEGALNRVVNRPLLLIFSALFSLAYTVIDILNPLTAIVFGFSSIGQGDILGTIISLLQTVLSPNLLLKAGLWVVLGIVIITFIVSPLLSGYFYILDNTLKDIQKQEREFVAGIKMYFKKLFRVNLTVFTLVLAFILFICVITVPALFTTWSWRAGRAELMGMALLLDIITAVVVFFAFAFFQLYTIFWYPSVFNFKEKPFSKGKIIVDNNFWTLVGKWIVIDLIFIIVEFLFLFFRYRTSLGGTESSMLAAVLYVGKFIFYAAYFIWVTTYTFASFKSIKE